MIINLILLILFFVPFNVYCQNSPNILYKEVNILSEQLFNNEKNIFAGIDSIHKHSAIYNKKEIKLKNPYVTTLLALIPGFFVGGVGHFYINRYKTGILLLMLKAIPLADAFKQPTPTEGNISRDEETGNLMTFLFLGTWFYDIIASPIHCVRDNRKKMKNISIQPYFKPNSHGNQIGLKLSYYL